MKSIIRDAALAPAGAQKIAWVKAHMPVLSGIGDAFEREQPFRGRTAATPKATMPINARRSPNART